MKQQATATLSIAEFLERQREPMKLRLLAGEEGLDRYIDHPRMQKPSLAFAGFMENLLPNRLQVVGKTELSYLATKSPREQEQVVNAVFDLNLAAVVITRGMKPPDIIVKAAERTSTPLISSKLTSSAFMTEGMHFLMHHLAPRTYQHGNFLDIFGLGVLLMGSSGIGKSEIALELISRGHRLIADDMVELVREGPGVLVGKSPVALRYHMEIRGMGILNIRDLFGAAALTDTKRVSLVVELLPWDRMTGEERLLVEERRIELNGVELPKVLLPIRPGRSLAVLIEAATRNQLLRMRGIDSGKAFIQALEERIQNGKA
jgi:HPr kinase/phosphorylase